MRNPKFIHCLSVLLLSISISWAQIPEGYYNAAEGKEGFELKTALFGIVSNGHTNQGYSALWSLYQTADVRSDGFVWEIYSDCDFVFGTDQDSGSGGTTECDKYNREHTFPQSWFNELAFPRSDGHMVMPSDKKANAERGNLPYGEVSNASYTTRNGGKKGNNTFTGYSGLVFEPADEYKGDLARIYFYMATRYENLIDGWESNSTEAGIVLNGTQTQVYETWVVNLLLKWHSQDPVSEKEINRNNDVFDFQGNRNPFVDHPEFIDCIWKGICGEQTEPEINLSLTNINFGTFTFEETIPEQTYTVSAEHLEQDLQLSATGGFEIFAEGISTVFDSQVLLPRDEANKIDETTIRVRFVPTENTTATYTGKISHSSADMVEEVNLSVTVNELIPDPEINISASSLTFQEIVFGDESEILEYTLSADNLTEELSLSTESGFEFFIEGLTDTFTNQLSIAPDEEGSIDPLLVKIKFVPTENSSQTINSTLEHQSSGHSVAIELSISVQELIYDPEISISVSELNFIELSFGENSEQLSYTLAAEHLTENLSVSASEGFQISIVNITTGFVNQVSIVPNEDGSIQETSILVRYVATENVDQTVSGNITHSSSGLSSIVSTSIQVNSVPDPPQINLSAGSLDFGTLVFGNDSEILSYELTADNLSQELSLTAEDDFQISLANDADFSSALNLPIDENGQIESTTIFVRYLPTENTDKQLQADLIHTDGAITQTISLSVNLIKLNDPEMSVEFQDLDFGEVFFGQSSPQFAMGFQAAHLSSPLLIQSSEGFEFSLGEEFVTELNVEPGNAENIDLIQLRFRPETNQNSYASAQLILSSSGLSRAVNLTGLGLRTDFNTSLALQEQFSEFFVPLGQTNSATQEAVIFAGDLIDPLEISVNEDFKIAFSDLNFSNSLSIDAVDFELNGVQLFVKYEPTDFGKESATGLLTFTHRSAVLETFELSASVEQDEFWISFEQAAVDLSWADLPYTLQLTANKPADKEVVVNIELEELNKLNFNQLITTPSHQAGFLSINWPIGVDAQTITISVAEELQHTNQLLEFQLRMLESEEFDFGNHSMVNFQVQTDEEIIASSLSTQHSTIVLFPNPVQDRLNLSMISVPTTIEVIDLQGAILLSTSADSATSMDVSYLNSGLYLVRMSSEMGQQISRIIKL